MNWLLLNSGKCDAAFNMALDESLLENVSRFGQPVLRFYGWTEPAATFGYFQKFTEVEHATHLRPLIRRPTGGGIVPHDADWTYSAVFPPGHEWHSLKAEESYRRIHDWLRLAFAELKIETELASCCKKSVQVGRSRGDETHSGKISQRLLTSSPTNQCFTGHEKFDLLWRGRKIAGAAQRRNKSGLLIQGSVQPPPVPLARTDWEKAMLAVAREKFPAVWSELVPDEKLRELAEEFACEKFSQAAYNCKR
jgi:lipoate-protein ligase A